jgi:hypothetical protein
MYRECTINYHIRGSNKLVVWNFDACIYFSPMFRHTQPPHARGKAAAAQDVCLGMRESEREISKEGANTRKGVGHN